MLQIKQSCTTKKTSWTAWYAQATVIDTLTRKVCRWANRTKVLQLACHDVSNKRLKDTQFSLIAFARVSVDTTLNTACEKCCCRLTPLDIVHTASSAAWTRPLAISSQPQLLQLPIEGVLIAQILHQNHRCLLIVLQSWWPLTTFSQSATKKPP